MKKKIALLLALAMLINCVAWADDQTTKEEDEVVMITVVVAVGLVLIVGGIVALAQMADADAPDDGLRLVSMPSSSPSFSETGWGTALKILQHVDFGVTADNKAYLGLRFQF
jgi:hypothetical protein